MSNRLQSNCTYFSFFLVSCFWSFVFFSPHCLCFFTLRSWILVTSRPLACWSSHLAPDFFSSLARLRHLSCHSRLTCIYKLHVAPPNQFPDDGLRRKIRNMLVTWRLFIIFIFAALLLKMTLGSLENALYPGFRFVTKSVISKMMEIIIVMQKIYLPSMT